jgi:CheY-like chemotaxis protein
MNSQNSNLILMADDDADDRLLVMDALADCPETEKNIHFVGDGEELMDYLMRRNKYAEDGSAPTPGLILLDLNMPRKDGREALKEIRACAELRRIPVVMFTTSKADTDVSSIYDLGANSFVTKPTAYDALVKIMGALTQYWFGVVELPQARKSIA